jgi:hypothetical protein
MVDSLRVKERKRDEKGSSFSRKTEKSMTLPSDFPDQHSITEATPIPPLE